MSHAQTDWYEMRCACGKQIASRINEHGQCELVHVLPACAEFDAANDGDDALKFLRRARMAAQARAGIGAA